MKRYSRMNILMLNLEFPPLGGGAGNANLELLKEFSKIKDLNIELITSSSENKFEITNFSENIKIHKLDVCKKDIHYWTTKETLLYTLKAYFYAKNLLKKKDYDLCHCFFTIPCGMIIYFLNLFKRNKVKYIVSLRGFDVPGFNPRLNNIYFFWKPLIIEIWKNSRFVIANSYGLKKLALQTDKNRKIKVICNAINSIEFYPKKTDHKNLKLLVVSRLIPRKGIEYIIRAMKEISKENKDIELVIAGEGPELENLKNLSEKIKAKISFLGYVKHDNLPELYRNSDIFILPSLYEGMSNTILEAMASGLSIITTDTGGTKELINGNGIIIKKKSSKEISIAVIELLKNSEKRQRFAIESRKISLNFSWQEIAGQYLELYRAI